jgi:phosphate starvation-inducible protein PhoH
LTGSPGTGKSFLALFKALEDFEAGEQYQKIVIVRSSVSGRAMGFLPGSSKEKMEVFEAPYISIVNELYGRGDAYSILKNKGIIEFISSSFLRGTTWNNMIVIVDECQNMSYQELSTILTRFGSNCKLILCGDVNQDDLTSERYNETSGYAKILEILQGVKRAYSLTFGVDDIVRSGFVKDFIIAANRYEKRAKRSLNRQGNDQIIVTSLQLLDPVA